MRSSPLRCSMVKNVLRNSHNSQEKRLCQSLSCEFCEISKNTFFAEHLWMTASETFFFSESVTSSLNAFMNNIAYYLQGYIKFVVNQYFQWLFDFASVNFRILSIHSNMSQICLQIFNTFIYVSKEKGWRLTQIF